MAHEKLTKKRLIQILITLIIFYLSDLRSNVEAQKIIFKTYPKA